MWAKNLLIGITIVAAGLAVAGGVEIAHPYTPIRPATTAELHQIALRKQYGFTTNLARVREIDATHAVSSYGFAMSSHERALFRARSQVGQFVGTVDTVAHTDAAYAGIWLEQKGAGTIVIGWTTKLSTADADRISAVVPSWVPIRFQRERYSYARLTAVSDAIGASMGPGSDLATVGVDVVHNRVDATVLTAAGARSLAARYPSGLVHATKGALSTTD